MVDQAITIVSLTNAPRLPLLGWILLQEQRDDIVGDLAEDAKKNPAPFKEISTLIEYSEKLPGHTWQALARAYFECYCDVKDLGHCLIPEAPLPWELRKGSKPTL